MPIITDEKNKILNPLGNFELIGLDSIRCIIDFCMPRALFSLRRASSAFLNLPIKTLAEHDSDAIPYIEQRLLKICVSEVVLSPGSYKFERKLYKWNTHCPMSRPIYLSPFQAIAFSSSYALSNYSVAQRISLAWNYDSTFRTEVLGIDRNLCQIRNNHTIEYMMNYNHYYNLIRTEEGSIKRTTLAVMRKLAYLGVTKTELDKIPLSMRLFIILNQITLDRKEIDFIIDRKNKIILLDDALISRIKQLIKLSPKILDIGVYVIHENQGTLIKPRISTCCLLYKKGSNRMDYLVGYLENHLQILGIAPQQDLLPAAINIDIDLIVYRSLIQELDSVIDLLNSDYLTDNDIQSSKENGYNLYMLQVKVEQAMEQKEKEENLKNDANQILIFSPNHVHPVNVNLDHNVKVQKSNYEPTRSCQKVNRKLKID